MHAADRLRLALCTLALCLAGTGAASAQPAQPLRVTAAITAVQGDTLHLKSAEGELAVTLSASTPVYVQAAAKLADIRPGSFLGVGAMPQADGSQQAIRVMIFPESMRGQGEGHRPWNRPGTTMTNATVDTAVTQVEGQVLTVKYKDGEQKIVIRPDAEILTYVLTDRTTLKAGMQITASGKLKGAAAMDAERIIVSP